MRLLAELVGQRVVSTSSQPGGVYWTAHWWLFPALGALPNVVRESGEAGIDQCDTATIAIRLQMLRTKPVATRAALHHRVLIAIVMTAWRVTLRGDNDWF